jgi:hypothetical protein
MREIKSGGGTDPTQDPTLRTERFACHVLQYYFIKLKKCTYKTGKVEIGYV